MEAVPRKSFRLTRHELTIHLIASGLVRLCEHVQRGEPITYPYPVALQQGLNRLLVACIQKGISPVQGVPDLLDWCRRPIRSWELGLDLDEIDETDTLLDDPRYAPAHLPRSMLADYCRPVPLSQPELA